MSVIAKHTNYISKKLVGKQIDSIDRIKRLPKEIKYFTWSLGFEAETDFSYFIKTKEKENYYCIIVTFLSLFILQSKFFKEVEGEYVAL